MAFHRFSQSPEFLRLIAGESRVDLARIALELAADAYPGLDIRDYRDQIAELAERIRPRCPKSVGVREVLGQINWVLFVEEEFRGNVEDYYDPRNSYLNEVLDRRLGIPISLSVIYWSVAESLGLTVAGANVPGHFLLRIEDKQRTWFVDPYQSGAVMAREICRRSLAEKFPNTEDLDAALDTACPVIDVVARMLRNLKAIYLKAGDFPSAVPIQRRLAALRPLDPDEVRDLGVLGLKADRPDEVVGPLQAYLAANPEGDSEIAALLAAARRGLAAWN